MVFNKVPILYYSKLIEAVPQTGLVSVREGIPWSSLLFASRRFSIRWSYVSSWGLLVFYEGAYSMDFALYCMPSIRRSFIARTCEMSSWYCCSKKLIFPLILEADPCTTPIMLHVLLLSRCCPRSPVCPAHLSHDRIFCLHLLAKTVTQLCFATVSLSL